MPYANGSTQPVHVIYNAPLVALGSPGQYIGWAFPQQPPPSIVAVVTFGETLTPEQIEQARHAMCKLGVVQVYYPTWAQFAEAHGLP